MSLFRTIWRIVPFTSSPPFAPLVITVLDFESQLIKDSIYGARGRQAAFDCFDISDPIFCPSPPRRKKLRGQK